MGTFNKAWFMAAGVRAVKTFFQVLVSVWVVGARIESVDWVAALSVAGGAFVFSIITSMAGLPELKTDGTMTINTSDPKKDVYSLELNSPVADLANKSIVSFTVKK